MLNGLIKNLILYGLTHRGCVMHIICISKLDCYLNHCWSIVSCTLGTNFSENCIKFHKFAYKEIYLKMSGSHFVSGPNVLNNTAYMYKCMAQGTIPRRHANICLHTAPLVRVKFKARLLDIGSLNLKCGFPARKKEHPMTVFILWNVLYWGKIHHCTCRHTSI